MSLSDRELETDLAPRIGRSVSIDHAALLLGVSRRTVYNRIRDGKLQTVRTLGGSQRVTLESVEQLGGHRPDKTDPLDKDKMIKGVVATAVFAIFMLGASIQPAEAQRRARISEDLADHLASGSQAIDVIVHGSAQEVTALARKFNLPVRKRLRSGGVVRMNASQLAAVQSDDSVDHLSGDTRIQSQAIVGDVTAASIGADQLWNGANGIRPLSGRGIAVAVIDTGIDTRHSAFGNRVLATVDFTGGDGMDRYGHGTHVASVIAGSAGRTAGTATYRGIAHGAYLINLRALGDDGSGTASDVIEAIDWAIDHKTQYNIRVINLSLGAPVLQPYRDDPLCEAVERATRAGILVVAAAGNNGQTEGGIPQFGLITSPGNSPYALTVGALDTHYTGRRSDDTLAAWSSKGPTRFDLVLKPDVAAPGAHVVGAESTQSYLSRTYPARHVTGSGAGAYIQLSGTSMSSAVVSGAAALMLDHRASLRPGETKAVLQLTSSFVPDAGLTGAGAGSLNILATADFMRESPNRIETTIIRDEEIYPSLIAFDSEEAGRPGSNNDILRGNAILRRNLVRDNTIVWGSTIVWGNTIVWGSNVVGGNTIVWGNTIVRGNTIVWGSTIVWGNTIVWGSSIVGGSTTVGRSTTIESNAIVRGSSQDDQMFSRTLAME